MSTIRSDEAQSFVLRFWYERSRIDAGHWRGVLWHYARDPADNPQPVVPQPVVDPEEAFMLVRHALARATPDMVAQPPPEGAGQFGGGRGRGRSIGGLWARVVRAIRRMFEARP